MCLYTWTCGKKYQRCAKFPQCKDESAKLSVPTLQIQPTIAPYLNINVTKRHI